MDCSPWEWVPCRKCEYVFLRITQGQPKAQASASNERKVVRIDFGWLHSPEVWCCV